LERSSSANSTSGADVIRCARTFQDRTLTSSHSLSSQITFQLNTAEKETREDVVARTTFDLPGFLEDALDKVATVVLEPIELGHPRSTITVMAKYIPIDMQILPRESIKSAYRLVILPRPA
jgi:hypothetical protein